MKMSTDHRGPWVWGITEIPATLKAQHAEQAHPARLARAFRADHGAGADDQTPALQPGATLRCKQALRRPAPRYCSKRPRWCRPSWLLHSAGSSHPGSLADVTAAGAKQARPGARSDLQVEREVGVSSARAASHRGSTTAPRRQRGVRGAHPERWRVRHHRIRRRPRLGSRHRQVSRRRRRRPFVATIPGLTARGQRGGPTTFERDPDAGVYAIVTISGWLTNHWTAVRRSLWSLPEGGLMSEE